MASGTPSTTSPMKTPTTRGASATPAVPARVTSAAVAAAAGAQEGQGQGERGKEGAQQPPLLGEGEARAAASVRRQRQWPVAGDRAVPRLRAARSEGGMAVAVGQ